MNYKSFLNTINSWDDFQSKCSALKKKEKGDAFELLTKLYFKINPVYHFYDEVWLLSEVPQKELEYLGLPSLDLGIDLIAKNGNEYHAIQCKYHSEKSNSVTFKEVSTFISLLESNDKFSQGYICSSANITSRNYNKLETKPINLILSDSWQQLGEEFFNQVRNLLDRKKYAPKPYKPFKHQIKALKQAEKYFNKDNNARGKLIFPCGSGKSLTGFWITQQLKSKSTIVAVPSLALVKQTLDVYLREIVAKGIKVKWLCICSDEGIGRSDDVVYYTENLGVPCQTDPEYIENWLQKNRDEQKVVFTTYQSGRIIAEVSKRLGFAFDVGIFDEAHKTVGSDKKLFSHLLFDENISVDKRIFMTATERFYTGSKDDIISMDDDDIYGDTFAQMSFKEAIELDLLTDYKIITIDIKKSEIADFIKENNLVQLNDKWKKETEARSLASMLALRKAMKQFPIKNAVSFHSSIEKAKRNKELQQYITDTYHYQPIDTYTVSGKIPTTKRNDIVQEFASSDKALITNARCLTEGVDVPNIDCIVFADPRKSRVDIVQALGRALRKKKGKDWGYVILPVVYNDETKEIDNENFNEILAIVRGLASNDERIIEYFKDKNNTELKRSAERTEQFNFEVLSDYIDEAELSKELEIKLWDKLAKFNMMPFNEAREFVHDLGLKSNQEWREYCKSGLKPNNIPHAASRVYKNKGWSGWGDWLGTGTIANKDIEYLSFEEARDYVHKLKLKSTKFWIEYSKSGKKPDDIPTYPSGIYENSGWKGMGDWLGTGTKRTSDRKYLPFEEAREIIRKFNIKTQKEWHSFTKTTDMPRNIPKAPNHVYKGKGWVNLGDWLGTGYIAPQKRVYLTFIEAREYVHQKNLKNAKEWSKYCKSGLKPIDIPSKPMRVYKEEWQGVGDWLGNDSTAPSKRVYRDFEKARDFVRKLNLKSYTEWRDYCKSGKKPNDIPTGASRFYKKQGWKGYGDWLGTGYIAASKRIYRTFEEARDYVRKLGIQNNDEWNEYCKSGLKPDDIPAKPSQTYKNKGWDGIRDWIGREAYYTTYEFREYKSARDFARNLGLKSAKDWFKYAKSNKKPTDIPSTPHQVYSGKGWIGWADFLGKDNN